MRNLNYYAALVFGVFFVVSCDATVNTCVMDPASTANVTADGSGCQTLQCMGDSLDCNQNATDGCETNVSADVTNCGSCGYKCPAPATGEATGQAAGTLDSVSTTARVG